jgi:hypothetical protein
MINATVFLLNKVESYDLALVKIVGVPGPQVLRAFVEKIYTAKKGMSLNFLGKEIDFVSSPGHWGNVALNVGDRAIVFLKSITGQLYEDPWKGHLILEDIDGVTYASFQERELWLRDEVPDTIRINSRQDPLRSYATAIRFDIFEKYLTYLTGING